MKNAGRGGKRGAGAARGGSRRAGGRPSAPKRGSRPARGRSTGGRGRRAASPPRGGKPKPAASQRQVAAPQRLRVLPDEGLERAFEGGPALQQLLTSSGSLADVEDVAGAFLDAARAGVPASVVIQALWEDEPRFESPAHARRLYGNLFGLFELISSHQHVELGSRAEPLRVQRERATRPPPLTGERIPDDDFVEAAWRYLDDHPKERERYVHAFNNRFDDLVSWLDESGLTDAGFALASHLSCDLFAMIDLAGFIVGNVFAENVPATAAPDLLPAAFTTWIDEGVSEEEQDDEAPLPPHEGAAVRELTTRLVAALWAARR